MNILNELPDNVKYINLYDFNLFNSFSLPDFSRFGYLIILDCPNKNLTDLSSLTNHQTLSTLICHYNNLTQLPRIPNLNILDCNNNQLTFLPQMPKLTRLFCNNNQLNFLPELPEIKYIDCHLNPIYDNILTNFTNPTYDFNSTYCIIKLKKLNKFRELYFILKLKNHFINYLWERIRKPKIELMYHPSKLVEFIEYNRDNWEESLERW